MIAYELLAGKRPFVGTDDEVRRQHLEEMPAHLEELIAEPGAQDVAYCSSSSLRTSEVSK